MRFALLGPITVTNAGKSVEISATMPRTVLAVLLLHANTPVSVDRLTEALWGECPPPSATASVMNHLMRLRRMLGDEGGARIRTVAHGYQIRVEPGELDVDTFADLCAAGRAAAQGEQWAKASADLAAALDLWRGSLVADVPDLDRRDARVQQLLETRSQALEGRIEADLQLGRHRELVSELRYLAASRPLSEAFHRQLMLALYRSERQAEALEVFQRLRRILVEELAVEPSAPLQDLHRRILRADPGLAAPADAAAPQAQAGPGGTRFQLPTDTRVFTGRLRELDQLVDLVGRPSEGTGTCTGTGISTGDGTVVISAIDGMAGIGKTALAVHAAHRLRDAFPDGQLFVDLRSYSAGLDPLTAGEALDRLLRFLGVPLQLIPQEPQERAAVYRARLADTRTLIVLDNAGSTAQVRPLLPGAAGCLVLVTSRKRLTGLDDAHFLTLDLLPEADAVALLHTVAGPGRIGANHPAIPELIALCGHLPLAIRIVAARLRHRSTLRIEDLVERLRDENTRLENLRDEDRNLTAVFDSSYAALPAAERQLVRRLGLVPGPDLDAYAAANLTGTDYRTAEDLLESLLDHNLLAQHSPGRYRLHDLIRVYALNLDDDPAEDREAALDRLLDYYEHTLQAADRHLASYTRPGPAPATNAPAAAPHLAGQTSALNWLRAERDNLQACLATVTDRRRPTRVLAFTSALAAFLHQEGPWRPAAAFHHTAISIAHELGDRFSEANARCDLGRLRQVSGDLEAAADLYQQALTIYQDLGDRLGEANVVGDLGRLRYATGEFLLAGDLHERAIAIYQDLGDRLGEANSVLGVGYVRYLAGDYAAAGGLAERALAIYQDLGHRSGEAYALWYLGRVRHATGDFVLAADLHERALTVFEELGHRSGEAFALWDLGRVRHATGDLVLAAALHERALTIFEELGHRHGEANTLHELGRVWHATGDYSAARDLLKQALEIFHDVGDPQGEAEVLNSTGALLAEITGPHEALPLYQEALRLAREAKSPVDEARALEGIARCAAQVGDREAALTDLREAVALYQRVGAVEAEAAAMYLAKLENQDARGI
jgi:DNA-binding SARP family transcriptional activator